MVAGLVAALLSAGSTAVQEASPAECQQEIVMKLEEKVALTLDQLGIRDPASVQRLFAEVREALLAERQQLVAGGAADEADRIRLAKALRDRWLGRKNGLLSFIDEHWLKPAERDLKPSVGRAFNELRQLAAELEVERLAAQIPIRAPHEAAESPEAGRPISAPAPDLSLPGYRRPLGSIHPITRVQREIEEIFLGLGYRIETGPEIESTYYNFDALNIPESHPSRDDVDTFYLDARTVLRTHTSPVQIRAMQKFGAPLYIIIPGKCYRRDNPDATHSPMFHQMEGLAIDEDITFADLKGTLDYFAKRLLGERTRTRLTPSFFPFTEPSGELAVSCFLCEGKGCRTCKQSGWIELGGCGMVHPEVLCAGGINPDRYSGWAFGMGIERFAMTKYDIGDIQLFFQSDVRFLEQF
jgi:phenylalanyl-tRNA synthetase alpha chain